MGEQNRGRAEALDWADSGRFIDELMNLAETVLRRDGAPTFKPGDFDNTLGFKNSRRKDLLYLLGSIKQSDNMASVPKYFWEYLQQQCEPGTRIAVKAADQVMSLHCLKELSPDSRKVVIVRDGRDAAISAAHYRRLMQKRDAPWKPRKASYFQILRAWALRANRLYDFVQENSIAVIRYEDLKHDFIGVSGPLFKHLGMPTGEEVLKEIRAKTDFTKVSGGRLPGESADHVVRKGVVGEWKEQLTDKESAIAWGIAGKALGRFGYTEDGKCQDNIEFII